MTTFVCSTCEAECSASIHREDDGQFLVEELVHPPASPEHIRRTIEDAVAAAQAEDERAYDDAMEARYDRERERSWDD